jgi:hypothetical protein
MAKEDNVIDPDIGSMITKTVSLFADIQEYDNAGGYKDSDYNPAGLHIHSRKSDPPVGSDGQTNYVNSLSGDKINALMAEGDHVSQDPLRTQLGKLWYNNSDGTIDLLNNVYDNDEATGVSFPYEGFDITFSTPFIYYNKESVENVHLLTDRLQMEKLPDTTSSPETYRIHVGYLQRPDSDLETLGRYKINRFFNFAKRLAKKSNIKKIDLVSEIQVLPTTTGQTNAPSAYIQNEIIYNEHIIRNEISKKVKEISTSLVNLAPESLLPNYNCHSLYQEVKNFDLNSPDDEEHIKKYKNYLRDFLTFKNSEIVTNLDQSNIDSYLTQYLDSLNIEGWTGNQLRSHLVKSTNVVIMQSMLKYMKEPINNFYFPVGSKFDMLLPITDDKVAYNTDTLRRKSLIEVLDRWDLDYAVLKAIVENVGLNPWKEEQKFKDGYKSNYATGRPLFNAVDSVMTFPSIGYSANDSNHSSGKYLNINSFPFLSFEFFRLQHQKEEGTNFGDVDMDFFSLYIMMAYGDEQVAEFFKFSSYGDNIYDEPSDENSTGITNHIYLDVPGYEDSDRPFIKREVAENPDVALPALENLMPWDFAAGFQESNLIELFNFKSGGGKTRNFENILDGEKASSEIVYWRVEKKDKQGNLIQNFFIPNAPEFNPKVFIDNQLIAEKEYEYTIYAWCVIYGTTYSYRLSEDSADPHLGTLSESLKLTEAETMEDYLDEDPENPDNFNFELVSLPAPISSKLRKFYFDIIVESLPHLQMVEIPYYSIGGIARSRVQSTVITSIPSPPAVEVVPYEGTNNAMLFLLNAAAGTIEKDFMIGINPEDDEKLYSIYQMLMNNNTTSMTNDMKVEFNTTSVDRFEIYRLEEKPKSYKDFTNGKLIGLDGLPGIKPTEIYGQNESAEEIITNANTLSFKDVNIVPNKKYYYTFRVIDKSGNFSNPTAVYEIEIVDDNGTIYPIIDTVDFDFETNLQNMKNVRKYLHIIPTLEQSLLDEDTDPPNYEEQTAGGYLLSGIKPKLGLPELEHRIFKDKDSEVDDGKKEYFKVRMTSKKTGKKIDINLKFKVKHNETKEEKKSLEQGTVI